MYILKKIALTLLLSLSIAQLSYANTTSPAAELSQLLNNLNEFSADFSQKTYNSRHKLLQKSEGRLALLRPGNFRWETLTPMHQLLMTNGKTLWIYDVDLEQVTQQKLSNQGALNPAQLLSGSISSLEQQFIVSEEIHSHYQVFKLIPKVKEASVSWIGLYFKNQQLVEMQFANELGEINDFEFSHIQNQLNLKPQDFTFVPPPGVDVLVNE
ncbi:MAG TPA: outer membrane lipoprotein chaperone LolA [Coxiellaceae bacterium]|nr:outer membrane lipoprotein chaperone LolA [Coxiellaceae bacterium]